MCARARSRVSALVFETCLYLCLCLRERERERERERDQTNTNVSASKHHPSLDLPIPSKPLKPPQPFTHTYIHVRQGRSDNPVPGPKRPYILLIHPVISMICQIGISHRVVVASLVESTAIRRVAAPYRLRMK